VTAPAPRPVWGADCPISMPVPAPATESKVVGMFGFSMTQYRLVHDITAAEYESLRVPVYAPINPAAQQADDAAIDAASS
jgi:hypothetical protein